MPKEQRIKTLIESQHVKGSETLLKSGRKYFRHIFDHSGKKIGSKNSFLVVSEIFRVFVNILTPNDKYSVSVKASVARNQFKCYYLMIKKYFFHFLFCISGTHIKFGILWKKRWASAGYLLLKLKTAKSGVT